MVFSLRFGISTVLPVMCADPLVSSLAVGATLVTAYLPYGAPCSEIFLQSVP